MKYFLNYLTISTAEKLVCFVHCYYTTPLLLKFAKFVKPAVFLVMQANIIEKYKFIGQRTFRMFFLKNTTYFSLYAGFKYKPKTICLPYEKKKGIGAYHTALEQKSNALYQLFIYRYKRCLRAISRNI